MPLVMGIKTLLSSQKMAKYYIFL